MDRPTIEFSTEDVLLAAEWAKAEALFNEQRAKVTPAFDEDHAPLYWYELTLEGRLEWWEQYVYRETFR